MESKYLIFFRGGFASPNTPLVCSFLCGTSRWIGRASAACQIVNGANCGGGQPQRLMERTANCLWSQKILSSAFISNIWSNYKFLVYNHFGDWNMRTISKFYFNKKTVNVLLLFYRFLYVVFLNVFRIGDRGATCQKTQNSSYLIMRRIRGTLIFWGLNNRIPKNFHSAEMFLHGQLIVTSDEMRERRESAMVHWKEVQAQKHLLQKKSN